VPGRQAKKTDVAEPAHHHHGLAAEQPPATLAHRRRDRRMHAMSALSALAIGVLVAPQGPATQPVIEASAPRSQPLTSRSLTSLSAQRLAECNAGADRGLRWLADRQGEAGAWTSIVGHKQSDHYVELDRGLPVAGQRATGRGHPGVTALCGLAFLSGGHMPDRGAYGQTVQRAIDYLIAHTHENGMVTDSGTRMYSHAFATLFLAEVYGMAGGQPVRDALQRSVNLIVDCQNRYGGWRYNAFDQNVDLSVTVCQLQALRAARNIGIKVPNDTIERALAYVIKSRVSSSGYGGYRSRGRRGGIGGQFYYKIYGRGRYSKPNEFAINAAALTALSSAGNYDPDLHDPTLDFLQDQYPQVAGYYGRHFYYWYGNYYACQAFFQTGGGRFRSYYERLTDDLLAEQRPNGRWRNDVGPGDEFSTAIACLLLQLPRQYLPIFQR